MCKQVSYSKYQKRVIKFLSEYLGTHTPFSYERTQTNHLKVLIDGVPKPLYTGSTPSDYKSINNFMAEVKRELRAANAEPETTVVAAAKAQSQAAALCFDKLIQTCIKSLRTRIEVMKSHEESQVLAAKSVDIVTSYRLDAVKHAIKLAVQARKQGGYIKPKDIRGIERAISKHLNFMLPSLAYYADLLDSKQKYVAAVPGHTSEAELLCADAVNDGQMSATTESREPIPLLPEAYKRKALTKPLEATGAKSLQSGAKPKGIEQMNTLQTSAHQLMAMSQPNRVSILRGLSKSQSLSLIDDIQQAMAMNRDEDIAAVVAMIREKDVPIEAIISRYEAA